MEKITKTSSLIQKLNLPSLQVRWITVKTRFKLQDDLQRTIDEEIIKPRAHPGMVKHNVVRLPEWLVKAIDANVDDHREEVLRQHKKFANYLFSRRVPLEEHQLKQKYLDIEAKLLGDKVNTLSEDDLYDMRKKIKSTTYKRLKEQVFSWKELEYNAFKSSLYLMTRGAAEFSVLTKIFTEIQVRDPHFAPSSVFDFGSGVGSVLWATTELWKTTAEYVGVDISEHMNDLAEKVGASSPTKIKGIYHRQYLPVSNLKFDLVVSAYSLMELPDAKSRLEVLSKLWRKTNKYLVIVEQGSNAGFTLVNEARDFIRHIMGNVENSEYFTFAPCPHDLPCPRRKETDRIPCNFLVQYEPLAVLGRSLPKDELYSYVVLRKDKRKEEDCWYRAVRPTLVRSKHARCRFCTPDGKLEEVVFSAKKDGKALYRCAKVTGWGARLAIQPKSLGTSENEGNQDLSSIESGSEESDDETEQMKEDTILSSQSPVAGPSNEKCNS